MKLESSVDMTYVNRIAKFGYDQINISYRNMLLKNISIPSKFMNDLSISRGVNFMGFFSGKKTSAYIQRSMVITAKLFAKNRSFDG